jgi:hypothetical protein
MLCVYIITVTCSVLSTHKVSAEVKSYKSWLRRSASTYKILQELQMNLHLATKSVAIMSEKYSPAGRRQGHRLGKCSGQPNISGA